MTKRINGAPPPPPEGQPTPEQLALAQMQALQLAMNQYVGTLIQSKAVGTQLNLDPLQQFGQIAVLNQSFELLIDIFVGLGVLDASMWRQTLIARFQERTGALVKQPRLIVPPGV